MIPFGEYAPDRPDFNNSGGATIAKNVLPAPDKSYRSLSSQSAVSGALTARCQGAFAAQQADGVVALFAGDVSKLYKFDTSDASFGDVSNGTYSVVTDENWEFTQFGTTVIAVAGGENPQAWTLGSSSAFADLGGSPPTARHVAIVRDFVVLGNTAGGTNQVRWSAIGDETSWSTSATTQADQQDIKGPGGWVQKIVGGEYGTIFLEHEIHRMTYVGSPLVFRFDLLEKTRGTPYPGSVAALGRDVFYISDDGFYVWNGTSSTPIGTDRVDKTFFADLNDGHARARISSAIDPIEKAVMWVYPSTTSSGNPDKAIIFNYSLNQWSHAEFDSEILVRMMSPGYRMETLDNVSGNLDTLAHSLDSRIWTGGELLLQTFDTDHKLASFTGTALDAVIETGEFQPLPGRRSMINRVRPIVDGSNQTTTIQMAPRNVGSDSLSFETAVGTNTTGDCPVRVNGRYHRVRCNISDGFDFAQGVDVTWKARGRR